MPPKELTLPQIRDIVTRRAFSELLNSFENESIDFKGEPYRLDDESQKLELAKDVSAFANTHGGFIVLGIRTKKIAEYSADVADELRPIPKNLFNQEQYESIARDWIYPPVNEIQITVFASDDDAQKVFAILEIPESVGINKPFLLIRAADDSKGRNRKITFGYAERFRSSSLTSVVQRLQQLLHLGLKFEGFNSFGQGVETRLGDLGVRMKRLEKAVLRQVQIDAVAVQEQREDKFEQNLALAAKETEMADRPHLILGAAPEPEVNLHALFSSSEDSVVLAFERPPEFRDAGFDFALDRPSEIIRGTIRRIALHGYKMMQLSTAGELIVLALGDENFLAWAAYSKPDQPIRINSFVLTEVIYAFAVYAKNIYMTVAPKPKSLTLYIGLSNMSRSGKHAILTSAEAGPYVMHSEFTDKKAPSPDCLFSFQVPFDETAERMAFLLRAKIYHWFGFDEGAIPYTTSDSDGRTIVNKASLFKNLGKDS
jgi:hypothetical protein